MSANKYCLFPNGEIEFDSNVSVLSLVLGHNEWQTIVVAILSCQENGLFVAWEDRKNFIVFGRDIDLNDLSVRKADLDKLVRCRRDDNERFVVGCGEAHARSIVFLKPILSFVFEEHKVLEIFLFVFQNAFCFSNDRIVPIGFQLLRFMIEAIVS